MITTILGLLGIVALLLVIVCLSIVLIISFKFLKHKSQENTQNSAQLTEPTAVQNPIQTDVDYTENLKKAQAEYEQYRRQFENTGMEEVINAANRVMGIETPEIKEVK